MSGSLLIFLSDSKLVGPLMFLPIWISGDLLHFFNCDLVGALISSELWISGAPNFLWTLKHRGPLHISSQFSVRGAPHIFLPNSKEVGAPHIWRKMINSGTETVQSNQMKHKREKRQRLAAKTTSSSPSSNTFACPKCNRLCRSRIGLYSHQRVCVAKNNTANHNSNDQRWRARFYATRWTPEVL